MSRRIIALTRLASAHANTLWWHKTHRLATCFHVYVFSFSFGSLLEAASDSCESHKMSSRAAEWRLAGTRSAPCEIPGKAWSCVNTRHTSPRLNVTSDLPARHRSRQLTPSTWYFSGVICVCRVIYFLRSGPSSAKYLLLTVMVILERRKKSVKKQQRQFAGWSHARKNVNHDESDTILQRKVLSISLWPFWPRREI